MVDKELCKVLFLPLLIAAMGMIMLFAVSFIPQSAIIDSLIRSSEELLHKPETIMGNGRMAYVMDYATDALIMEEAYTLSAEQPESLLTCPMLWTVSVEHPDNLARVAAGEAADTPYVRYWMGFRIFIRPLLLVFSYDGICWLISLLFFALATAVIVTLGTQGRGYAGLCFGLTLALINPSAVSHSPQYCSCFILSFIFILFLLLKKPELKSAAFCLFGSLTQFFDFYTAPLICFSLPMLLWIDADDESFSGRVLLKCMLAWIYGYVLMWLIKLAAVNIFTDIDGLFDGLATFRDRLSLASTEQSAEEYSALRALKLTWSTVFPGNLCIASVLVFFIAVISSLMYSLKRLGYKAMQREVSLLLVSLFSFLWIAVAAKPSCVHSFFQYRSLTGFFFGALLLVFRAVHLRKRSVMRCVTGRKLRKLI